MKDTNLQQKSYLMMKYLAVFPPKQMEKAMAPHSSTLSWKIPWLEEPGRRQSMQSLKATSLSLFTFMHWRRKWQPTPVFLPGESQGRGSLVGCRLWGHTESDTTEVTQQPQQQPPKQNKIKTTTINIIFKFSQSNKIRKISEKYKY